MDRQRTSLALVDLVPNQIHRFFSKLPCDKPIQRGSWGLEVGKPLFVQTDEAEWSGRQTQDPDLSLSNIYLRVDWQTLRRMPKSRAIVFNFRALSTPVTDFRREPYIPKLVLKVLLEGKKSIIEYKGTWHIEHKVIPALKEWVKEQEETGLVPHGLEGEDARRGSILSRMEDPLSDACVEYMFTQLSLQSRLRR
jgi:hypothetical protein